MTGLTLTIWRLLHGKPRRSLRTVFVGFFAQAFPAIDVLNAGVSSCAPSVYYEKRKYLLDSGLRFDEAVVYVDISDIQDEAILYSYDVNGVLQMGLFQTGAEEFSPAPRPPLQRPEKRWWEKVSYIGEFLGLMRYSAQWRRQVSRGGATFRKSDRILVDETRPQQNRQLDTGGDIH